MRRHLGPLIIALQAEIANIEVVGYAPATGEQNRIGVPPAAVVRRGEITGVYVQREDGRFVLRQVRLGELLSDGRIEVLAGLAPEESVATDAVKAGIALKRGAAR